MKYIKLGKTDLTISEIGFGCIPVIRLSSEEAVNVLQHAYEKGINFFDTANSYRDSEQKVGQALRKHRDKIVLATKTMKRDAAGAAEHLENSLRMLQTEYIDLYQFHQVSTQKEWEAIIAPNGAMEYVLKAKKQGKIRHIGITSHNLEMALQLINTGLFATIMFPFSFIEDSAAKEMLSLTAQKGMAFLSMKPFGGGVIDNAPLAFKFLRQYPEAIPIPGFDSIEYLNEVLSIYEQPNTVSAEDKILMAQTKEELGPSFCRRCEYCQPCPSGVLITRSMIYPAVAKRMSPAVSVEFSKVPIESIVKCTRCGICMQRCPYKLPIPDLLQKYRQMYLENLKSVHKETRDI